MKIQLDKFTVQSITGYGPGWVSVQGEKIESSIVVSAKGQRVPWQCATFQDLTAEHFSKLADMAPELVIFGSGKSIKFPNPKLLTALYARHIGMETMDTYAACRTYNILAGEGRDVVLALLIDSAV